MAVGGAAWERFLPTLGGKMRGGRERQGGKLWNFTDVLMFCFGVQKTAGVVHDER